MGETLSDCPARQDDRQHTGATAETGTDHQLARAWLGRLATYIASVAGGMAVNDISGTLGYHGLAGVVAFSGVVTAAVWIRGLDPRARLPRYAPPIFLVSAGCAAAIAAFNSGSTTGIWTALAAILTVGAVLVANELDSVATLLIGGGAIAVGMAVIAVGIAFISKREAVLGTVFIAFGVRFIAIGLTRIAERGKLVRTAGKSRLPQAMH